MRGADGYTESMFTMSRLDDFVPANHPLRPIRLWLNDALTRMDSVFSRMYESDAKGGRPSIAPEKMIRALLLQVLYSIRSERMLMEHVGLAMDDVVWDHSTFSKNRDRLMAHDVMVSLFNQTVETARVRGHLSGEHFNDTAGATCRAHGVTPHVAQNNGRAGGSAIDGRTRRWAGYAVSQRKRKCIEQVFGWSKTVGWIRQAMFRGL
jgi:transposase